MNNKTLSELENTNILDEDSIFHIRKPSQNEDFKITKTALVKQLGNSGVLGFSATETAANRLTLEPINGGIIDQYYEGMIVKFISPINSTDIVQLRIGNLDFYDLKTTFTNPITQQTEYSALKINQVYEVIYKNGVFTQINIDRQYTNEYLSYGEVLTDVTTQENYTLYNLTSATSYYKDKYYEGMAVMFTSGIIQNSNQNISDGKVYLNVDQLGQKELSDPDGDYIPFNLQYGETIMAIYDGTKFIKNMFSMQEPVLPDPIDPDNPPPGYDITIYLGPDEDFKTFKDCMAQLQKDYAINEKRKILIKLKNNYIGDLGFYTHERLTNFQITIEGNPNVIFTGNRTIYTEKSGLCFNITGHWKINRPTELYNQDGFLISSSSKNTGARVQCNFKDCIVENINLSDENICLIYQAPYDNDFTDATLADVELKNLRAGHMLMNPLGYGTVLHNGRFIIENLTITNTMTATRTYEELLILSSANVKNLIINLSKPSNYQTILTLCGPTSPRSRPTTILSDSTIILQENLTNYIVKTRYYDSNDGPVYINSCIIKYADGVNNTKGSLLFNSYNSTPLYLNGNDYQNVNTNTIPDIVVDNCTLNLKTGTIGSTQTINGGKINYV